jgi:hypothetical protein
MRRVIEIKIECDSMVQVYWLEDIILEKIGQLKKDIIKNLDTYKDSLNSDDINAIGACYNDINVFHSMLIDYEKIYYQLLTIEKEKEV